MSTPLDPTLDERLRMAVRHFWVTRSNQASKQGTGGDVRDHGERSAVTGGAQMDGFVSLIRDLLIECGLTAPVVYCKRQVELPGWFRPEKQWDLLVVVEKCLVATIEFKYSNRKSDPRSGITSTTGWRRHWGARPISGRPI